MANRLPQPVGYRPFRVQPILQEGVLPSPRDDGELERKVAAGLARMADEFGQQADRQAVAAGQKAGEADAMAGAPGASTVTGDAVPAPDAGNGNLQAQGKRVVVPPENIRGVISEAAARHGVDPNALIQIASVESGFDPNAKNPNSSAGGLFQFIDGTAKQYGLTDRFDPAQAADAAARLAKDNSAALKSALGRDPTSGELYLAHQQGAQGAIKLLSNPGARAADVVGGEAVSLNGGADGMTAGEFAAKWTSKFGSGSYKSIPSASSVAPVSVTPAAPVKIEPGKAGAFRPKEGDTLYARAYNVAGEKTYLQELKFTMLQDQDAVYDKYKDDPAMLQKAMGELYQAHVNEHVFPEIESEYRGWFQAGAYELQRKAQDAQQIRVKQQDLVDFQGRVQDLENNKSRVLAGMTFNDDTGSTQLAGLQAQIDDHYNAAVAKGMMTPQQAKQAREQSHAEMQVGYYSRQADGKSADEIASLRQTMQKDYSDNKLQGVSADEWELINKSLSAREREQRSQDHLAVTALSKRGNDIAARVMRGLPVDAAEYAKFQMDAGSTPEGEQIYRSTELKMRVADALRKQPIGEVESNLWPLMTAGGRAPTPDDYDAATKMVNSQKAELKQDPLGVAERFGIVPQGSQLPDPATASPDEMAEALNTRMVYADVAAQHFGVQPKYFRPEEEAVIKSAITSTDPNRNSSAMKQLDVFAARTGLLETEKTFGKDATDRLQDWQARVRYATPEEAQKWLTERNDPKWQERVKPLVTKGEAEARKLQPDDVVKLLNENGTLSLSVGGPVDQATQRAMMNDFTTLMGERYAASGDADTAKKQAVERMQKVWGTTGVYGNMRGRLMLYPPEEHYPTVAGSGNWMRDELTQVAQERGFKPENMALVSDGKTKAAIERNEPPGYLLSKVNPDTGLEELITDEKGRPLRHFFDVDAARKKALTQAEEARRTRNDPWLVFGNGTAIGPLYPGGADPADLADRQRRIQQIPAEQKQRLDTYEKTRQELPWAGIDTDIPGGQ